MVGLLSGINKPTTYRNDDPFPLSVVEAAKAHATRCYPEESCGIVTPAGYIECVNIHDEPKEGFRIDPDVVSEHTINGTLLAVLHSHPDGPNYPSYWDQKHQIASGLTWGIIPVIGTTDTSGGVVPVASQIIWWGDELPIPPLERRLFVWGVFHCYSLYRDWVRLNWGITIPNFPCPDDFAETGFNIFMDNFDKAGLVDIGKIDVSELQIGDMVVGHLRGGFPNHCGVYIGGDDLLHHPVSGASGKMALLRFWSHVDTVFRYDKENASLIRATS